MAVKAELLNKIIDHILSSETAKEWVAEDMSKIGKNEYYFSIHTLHLDIIEQFDDWEQLLKDMPELNQILRKEFEEWVDWHLKADDDLFDAWLHGGGYTERTDGYVEELTKELDYEYRKRITEEHTCEECGKAVSERYLYGNPNSLHRIGIKKISEEPERWEHKIFCKPCWDKHLKPKSK